VPGLNSLAQQQLPVWAMQLRLQRLLHHSANAHELSGLQQHYKLAYIMHQHASSCQHASSWQMFCSA
jgi:hypothetical protein